MAALTAMVAAVGVTACSGDGGRERIAVESVEVQGPTTIELVLATCVPDPEVVELSETEQQVSLSVAADPASPGTGTACDRRLRVPLDAPLGERAVVDDGGPPLEVSGRTRAVPVLEALVIGESTVLLNVPTCQALVEVSDVVEGAELVEVEVTATGGTGAAECLDGVQVTLDAPLGERLLTDATTGARVPITGYMAAGS